MRSGPDVRRGALGGVEVQRSAGGKLKARALEEAGEAARAAYFDLLRQLQNAVRTVILTATVSNSCVRCSDSLCSQLFRLVRSCLLAGCRRLCGADPVVDDLLLLLIVPEFAGAFARDLDFVAYLCVGHAAAAFARHLFADAARVAHFYYDFAIMADEELHLAFVSSLLALEPVNFHPDSPLLAQHCLSASLDDLRFLPPPWPKTRPALGVASSHEERKPASTPDRHVPSSDFGQRVARASEAELFTGFIASAGRAPAPKKRKKKKRPAPPPDEKCGESEAPDAAPEVEPEAFDNKPAAANSPTTDWTDWPQQALLRFSSNLRVLILEDTATETAAMSAEEATGEEEQLEQGAAADRGPGDGAPEGAGEGPSEEAEGGGDSRAEGGAEGRGAEGEAGDEAEEAGWRAADFAAELGDAFGLDVASAQPPTQRRELQAALSLRDLAGLASLASAAGSRPPRCVPPRRRRPMAAAPPPRRGAAVAAGLLQEVWAAEAGGPDFQPPGAGGAVSSSRGPDDEGDPGARAPREGVSSGGEEDEAGDAVASLEGLWDAARRESARRMLRSAGRGGLTAEALNSPPAIQRGGQAPGSPPVPLAASLDGLGASKRSSPASSTAATPRCSTPPSASAHGGRGGGGGPGGSSGGQDDALSDSDSEHSSGQSVSSASLLAARAASAAAAGAVCPTPFGVHLEWHLSLRPKLPRSTQVALQRGCCPGCKERLPPSTLFNAPRYCHYLGCYFCTNCHQSDLRIIPARVAERWDFEPRKVCSMSAKYLDSQVSQPLVPITRIRRTKVSSQASLTEAHAMRQKFARLCELAAESGCGFGDTLTAIASSQLEPHMAQGHELYSMQDLILIHQQGKNWPFYGRLSRLVHIGVEHAHVCPECRKAARFCPICDASAPLWAFQVEEYCPCPSCGAVYHRTCFRRADSECPLCLRLRAHLRKPSLAAVRPR